MQDPQQDGPRRRPQRQAQLPSTLGILLFVGLLAAAIAAMGAAASAKKERKEAQKREAAAEPAFDPFAKMHAERGTTPISSSDTPEGVAKAKSTPNTGSRVSAPTGLEDDDVWQAALTLGRKGDDLLAAAKAANLADDRATFLVKANAAKDAYDQALVDSASFEEALNAAHGPNSRATSSVRRMREKWLDNLVALRKTAPR